MSETSKLARLKESIHLYETTIASFEAARDRLLARRKGAIDSVMVLIDERLVLNQNTLDSLYRVLALAKVELKSAQGALHWSDEDLRKVSDVLLQRFPTLSIDELLAAIRACESLAKSDAGWEKLAECVAENLAARSAT